MKIRDLLTTDMDIDVYSDTYDLDGWAVCPPVIVTEEGEKEWGDVLDHEIKLSSAFGYPCALFNVGECADEDEEYAKTLRTIEFLESLAGYCSCEDYDKWFIIPD